MMNYNEIAPNYFEDAGRVEDAGNAAKDAVAADGESAAEKKPVCILPDMWVDFEKRKYRKGNEGWHSIPEKVSKMLEYFVKNEGKVLSNEEIYESAFDAEENEVAEDRLIFEFRTKKCVYMIREMLKGTAKEIVAIRGKRYIYGDYVEPEIEETDIVQEILVAANKESTIAKIHDKDKMVEELLRNELKEVVQELAALCVVNNLDHIGEVWSRLFGKVDDFVRELKRYLVFRKLPIGAAELFCDDYRMELRQGIREKKQKIVCADDKLAQDKTEILEAVDRYICFKVSDVLQWYGRHAL